MHLTAQVWGRDGLLLLLPSPASSAPRVRLGAAFRLGAFLCVSFPPAVSPAGGCGFVYVEQSLRASELQSLRVQREEALEIEGFSSLAASLHLPDSQFVPSLIMVG